MAGQQPQHSHVLKDKLRWYVSEIPAISTTFFLSCVLRIFLTALTSLLTTCARCTRRMATRFNVCRSIRARAFALQLRGSCPFTHAFGLSSLINAADARHKEQEQKAAATRSAAIELKALEGARARAPPTNCFKHLRSLLDTIFDG